jgi:hypothetical protein
MTSRRQLLESEDAGWRELGARMAKLTAGDWLRPGAAGEWTPKDVMAHIAAWHAEITSALEALRCREDPTAWPPDTDAFNADAHDRTADMTVREVEAMAGAARHRFREELAQVTEPVPDVIVERVRRCGDEHYAEHVPLLDAFLKAGGVPSYGGDPA